MGIPIQAIVNVGHPVIAEAIEDSHSPLRLKLHRVSLVSFFHYAAQLQEAV